MRKGLKLFAALAAAALLLTSVACTSLPRATAPGGQIEVSVDASYTTTGFEWELARNTDGSLIVTLESNPTTGFRWELTRNTNEAALELVDHKFEASKTTLLGAGGKEVWTFKTLKKGKSTIYMEYSRPWEQGVKAAETFVLTVVVE